jgi:hypothetical protein
MKKVIKFFSGFAVLVFLSFICSSLAPATTPPEGDNAVIVEMTKGDWQLQIPDCEGGIILIPSTENSTTTQMMDGLYHMVTIIFLLPEGHCFIPEKAVKEVYDYGGGVRETWLWTPDGKLIVKFIIN